MDKLMNLLLPPPFPFYFCLVVESTFPGYSFQWVSKASASS